MDAFKASVEELRVSWIGFRDASRASIPTRILGCILVLVIVPVACAACSVLVTYKVAKSVLVGK